MPNFKVGDKIRMLEKCGNYFEKCGEYSIELDEANVMYIRSESGEYRSCQDKWQLIEPSMKTWETLKNGDFVSLSHPTRIFTILARVEDLVALSEPGEEGELYKWAHIEEVKDSYTIVQNTPEIININGKKYLKSAVIERLEELDPIE